MVFSYLSGDINEIIYEKYCSINNKNRSVTRNLINPKYNCFKNPEPAEIKEIASVKFNQWTKFNYTNNSSLSEFKSYYEKMFKMWYNEIS